MINNQLRRKKDEYIELTRNIIMTTNGNTFLNTCIMNVWFEFDKYFKKLNKSPAYYASTALHPALKQGFFEDKWNGISNGVEESTWVIHARREVEDMWTRIYDLSTDEDSIELDDEPIGDDFEDFLKI